MGSFHVLTGHGDPIIERGLEPLLHRAIAEYLGEAGTTI
jgi:hypothetical protein